MVPNTDHTAWTRIIPAPAGNTSARPGPPQTLPDHPRTRGEHISVESPLGLWLGSSPHPRGTRRAPPDRVARVRIIPAPAGNTIVGDFLGAMLADHPRTRGEHGLLWASPDCTHGSSPHPRGTREARSPGRKSGRIIPAPAGNTWPRRAAAPSRPDHPRTRGEHRLVWFETFWAAGSSPHPRGTLNNRGQAVPAVRIIPAPAGNTSWSISPSSTWTDHPRTRGEHYPQSVV